MKKIDKKRNKLTEGHRCPSVVDKRTYYSEEEVMITHVLHNENDEYSCKVYIGGSFKYETNTYIDPDSAYQEASNWVEQNKFIKRVNKK